MELEALHPAGPSGLRSGPRAQPGVRPRTPPKTPGFNETTTGFKFLLQKTRETAIFGPSFTETFNKKKMRGFLLKPHKIEFKKSIRAPNQ